MPTPERKRAKATGKGAPPTFVMLRHDILDSPQWASLSGSAVRLLLELARQYRGPNTNNGNLVATQSLLKERGWSPAKIARAKSELVASRFVRKTRQGHRHLCDLFAITWWPIDECPGKGLEVGPEKVASHLWKTEFVVRERSTVVRQRTNQGARAAA